MTTAGINVVPVTCLAGPPTRAVPYQLSASVVYPSRQRKAREIKEAKLAAPGYAITFSMAMNQGSLRNSGNYVLDTVTTTKRTKEEDLH